MSTENNFVFGKQNIMLLIIGVIVAFLGFILMMGGGSEDPNVFNEDEMFSWTRITLAPILVIGGYVVVIVGIMKKNKS
ncbi:DUF3098 domain-containing protein [Paracrocinitomix mangrovi]|uniref:DUF3098 domain-containing protein n=1 Tax=Paracrocinitomix mangrovi TaxID=2862509 RepID=UPI001C8DA282|nr:DUF3098 domain-containing protein [Paracrocinitomix mangrovi]UKN00905.1 DUF3098 domain-containing protein [Paracrocinitomix mangrovi]